MRSPASWDRNRARTALGGVLRWARREAGGPARLRVVVLLASVYALQSADTGTVGALAPQLERALRLSNTQLGVIAAVAAGAGAIGTVPAGALTDRVNRVGLLSASIVLWSVAQLAGAFAPSFTVLVLTRVALGAVSATAGPAVASLTGDFFPAGERGRMLGLILTGELVGSGIGIVGSGDLASVLSWRYGFGWLAIPGLALAAALWGLLAEPARGGQSRLEPGAEELIDASEAAEAPRERGDGTEPEQAEQEVVREAARAQHVSPRRELVLDRDPAGMSLRAATRYVLRVPTNRVLIVCTALAYLFFSGVQTFAVELVRSRYHVGEAGATGLLVLIGAGAVVGIVLAGQLADRWLARGRLTARVTVGAIAYLGAVVLFVPGLLSASLLVAAPLLFVGAAGLAAPDSVLGAARLDIMHPHLWGRAEGVRTALQMASFALAPLLFGLLADALGGGGGAFAGGGAAGSGGGSASSANGTALMETFLIMLAPVAIAGAGLLWARRTYPRDVATATASVRATAASSERPRDPAR